MTSIAWSTSSWVTWELSVVLGLRISCVPPSRSSASFGASDAGLSCPLVSWTPATSEPSRAMTSTARRISFRPGRGLFGRCATGVFSRAGLCRRPGPAETGRAGSGAGLGTRAPLLVRRPLRVLPGRGVHRTLLGHRDVRAGRGGEGRGVVGHDEVLLVVLGGGERRLLDLLDGALEPDGLDAGGALEGDDVAV